MGVSKGIRSILFAGAALLALAVTPAFAQTTLAVSVDPVTDGVLIGSNNSYTVTITNTGTEQATGLQVTAATFPAELELVSVTAPAAGTPPQPVSGCNSPNTALPCSLTASTLDPGASVKVRVTAAGIIPAEPTCPPAEGVAIDPTTVTVKAANSEAVTSDPVANLLMPYTDLQVEASGAPDFVDPGSTHVITTTVTNAGPCAIADPDFVSVFFSWPFWSEPGDSYTVVGATGPCALQEVSDGECSLGAMDVGASQVITATVRVPDTAKDLTAAVYDTTIEVAADAMQEGNPDDNAAALQSRFEKSDSGCSSGGAGTLVSLLPLLAAGAWRRRRQA